MTKQFDLRRVDDALTHSHSNLNNTHTHTHTHTVQMSSILKAGEDILPVTQTILYYCDVGTNYTCDTKTCDIKQ